MIAEIFPAAAPTVEATARIIRAPARIVAADAPVILAHGEPVLPAAPMTEAEGKTVLADAGIILPSAKIAEAGREIFEKARKTTKNHRRKENSTKHPIPVRPEPINPMSRTGGSAGALSVSKRPSTSPSIARQVRANRLQKSSSRQTCSTLGVSKQDTKGWNSGRRPDGCFGIMHGGFLLQFGRGAEWYERH